MKISVIIISILITQVSASFFDVFQGAVLSVQNSFGKLLSDVVTDVRDTVDCTILAVEHVLSLSEEATAQYYEKCGNVNKTDLTGGAQQDGSLSKVEVSLELSKKGEFLQKEIPAEIDAKINETISKVLGNYNPHNNLLSVENVLAKESEQLADVSKLVKQELNKLSNEVHTDLKNIKQSDPEPSVDTILQEIKLLENKEQNTKNTSVATEIHQVIDEVLAKLDVIEVTEATENNKLDEILKNLENNSNNSFIELRQQFQDWKEEETRHLAEIKSKIEEHEKNVQLHDYIYKTHASNYSHPFEINIEMYKTTEPPQIKGPTKNSLGNETAPEESIKNAVSEPRQLSAHIKDIEPSNEVSSSTVRNIPTAMAYTMIDHMLNYTPATSTAFSSKKSSVLSLQENTTATENITLSTNKPTTIRKKVSDDVSNDIVTLVPNVTDYGDQESSLTVTSAPITVIKLLNENDHITNETVGKNSVQLIESTPQDKFIQPVEMNTNFNEEQSSPGSSNKDIPTSSKANTISFIDTVVTSTSNGIEAELTQNMKNSSNNDILNNAAFPILESIKLERVTYKDSSNLNTNELLNGNDYNDTLASDSSFTGDSVTESVTILPVEYETTPGSEESSTETTNEVTSFSTIAPYNDSNDTMIPNTLSPTISSTSVSEANQPIKKNAVSSVEESSSVAINSLTASVVTKDNDLAPNTSPSLILSTPVIDIIKVAETTTFSTIEEPLTTSIPSTSLSDTIQTLETVEKSSTVNINTVTTSTATKNNNNIATTTPLMLIVSTPVTDIIQFAETSTASTIEEAVTTSVPTINAEIIDESNVTVNLIGNTTAENEEYSTTTTHGLTTSDPNDHVITSMLFETSETTPIADINLPVKSTTPIAKGETTAWPTTQPIDYNNHQNDAVTTTEGANVNNQTEKIDKKLERQELTSTSSTEATSTVFTSSEKTPIIRDTTSPITTTIKNSEYRDLYTLTTNSFLPTPNLYRIREVNHVMTNRPTFAITEGPFVKNNLPFFHRPINPTNMGELPPMQHETTPYKLNQQNYPNTNGVPRNIHGSDIPQSLRDRGSRLYATIPRGIPARNYYNPYFEKPVSANLNDPRETKDSIRKRTGTLAITKDPSKDVSKLLLNKDSKMLTPDRYNPNIYNQEPNIKTDTEQQKAATEYKNYISKLMNSDAPPDIASHRKFDTLPASPTINRENAARRPERKNYINPPYVQRPQSRVRPPYSWDERAPNTYRSPRLLTTYKPMTTVPRSVNNYDNPPFDYDSFFHNSRNSEAHQRALKEAKELIEKSKRSHEIIDKILKNKNHNGARSVFNNPGTLNSGK